MPIDALSVLCAQLARDLLAIAKLLFRSAQAALARSTYDCEAIKSSYAKE